MLCWIFFFIQLRYGGQVWRCDQDCHTDSSWVSWGTRGCKLHLSSHLYIVVADVRDVYCGYSYYVKSKSIRRWHRTLFFSRAMLSFCLVFIQLTEDIELCLVCGDCILQLTKVLQTPLIQYAHPNRPGVNSQGAQFEVSFCIFNIWMVIHVWCHMCNFNLGRQSP